MRPHVCDICGDSFSQTTGLKAHITYVHEKQKKPEDCFVCGKSFRTKTDLFKHQDTVHDGKKPYKCHLCGACFGQRQRMKIHVESVHEGRKPFDCTICQKSFATKGKLDRHSTTVHRGMIIQWWNQDYERCFKWKQIYSDIKMLCMMEKSHANLTYIELVLVNKKEWKCWINPWRKNNLSVQFCQKKEN